MIGKLGSPGNSDKRGEIMRKICMIMVLFLLPATAFSAPELKGSPQELQSYLLDERSVVVVTGSGEERVKADKAIVSLVVKTKDDKFRAALNKNSKIRNDVKNKMISGGIEKGKIEIAKYSSTPSYSWIGDKPSSYEISNEINVSIENEDQLVVIAEVVDTVNEVYFLKTDFKHSKKQESMTKALEKSLDEVNSKKQLYEKSLGVSLSPLRIMDQSIHEDIPAVYQVQRKSYASGSSPVSRMDVSESESGEGASGFGEVIYKARTQVEFVINRKQP